jgi:hypothetical protein
MHYRQRRDFDGGRDAIVYCPMRGRFTSRAAIKGRPIMAKPKPEQDEKTGRFVTGNVGGGRAKGSRNLLGEAFIDDLYADWLTHGVATIEAARIEDPVAYLKVVASILPRDLNMKVSAVENMTNDELNATIERLLADPEVIAARQRKGSEPTEH